MLGRYSIQLGEEPVTNTRGDPGQEVRDTGCCFPAIPVEAPKLYPNFQKRPNSIHIILTPLLLRGSPITKNYWRRNKRVILKHSKLVHPFTYWISSISSWCWPNAKLKPTLNRLSAKILVQVSLMKAMLSKPLHPSLSQEIQSNGFSSW